jgi:Xaa-Pro aminopeptidase
MDISPDPYLANLNATWCAKSMQLVHPITLFRMGSSRFWHEGEFEEVDGFPRYPAAEMARRHAWVEEVATDRGLDAVVVGGATGPLETSVQYFSNWPSQVQSYVVFAPREPPYMLVRLWNHLPDAQRIAVIDDVRYGGDTPAEQAAALASKLAERGSKRVGLLGMVPHADYDALRTALPGGAFIDLNHAYQAFRLVKSDAEMVFTRIGSRMNDAAVAALASMLVPGSNELDIARIVEETYLDQRGINLIHFSLTTSMTDPRFVVPHQYHPNRLLAAGDIFVTEISTTFWGYAGQILRTFVIGAEPTARYARLHQVALETYQVLTGLMLPGVTVGSLLDAAGMINEAGFDIWDDLIHGFGGAYLPPIVRTRASRGATHPDDFAYPEGTLLVVQPNVIDGQAGVQVGNSMQITGEGPAVTQTYPTELIICG